MLPKFIEPRELARRQEVLQAELSLAGFDRAQDLLVVHEGMLKISWKFYFDHEGHVCAELNLQADLVLSCQRCQGELNFPLSLSIPMQVVANEIEAEALPLKVSPLYISAEGCCQSLPIIEDELILALPAFPMHEKNHCDRTQNQAYYDTLSKDVRATYRPFAQLKEKK